MHRLVDPIPMRRSREHDRKRPAPTVDELRREFPGLAQPILSIETIFVSDETVTVLGSVRKTYVLSADLIINGHLVPIGSDGRFCAIAKLHGYEGLNLSLETGIHGAVTLDVPLKAR